MASIVLTQSEADSLLQVDKQRVEDVVYNFPKAGGKISIPLRADSIREDFLLDLSRGNIAVSKVKYQTRGRSAIVLARLDLGGAPHTNPPAFGGKSMPCPHLHLYREGYGDKVAFALDPAHFKNPQSLPDLLDDFMDYCRIVQKPRITRVIV